ncbi:energy-coupling factor transporter transmembrane component T family protein [Stappia sp.]|uniref:energy-coupling factor transporter transmembrane component T family protein n=1 Tax=Stappia sp. TaxID=1870903 RepID=UPI003A99FBA1
MIGLYLAQRSPLHLVPAGGKLLGLALASLALFPLGDPLSLLACLAASLSGYALLGRQGLSALAALRPLVLILAFVLGLHALLGSFETGILVALRLATLFLLASLVTLTTRMDEMIDALRPVLRPAAWIGLPEQRLALAIALVIRFTPVIVEMGNRLQEAHRARSGRKGHVKLVAPLCLQALNTADHVAEALAARGGAAPDLSTTRDAAGPPTEQRGDADQMEANQ